MTLFNAFCNLDSSFLPLSFIESTCVLFGSILLKWTTPVLGPQERPLCIFGCTLTNVVLQGWGCVGRMGLSSGLVRDFISSTRLLDHIANRSKINASMSRLWAGTRAHATEVGSTFLSWKGFDWCERQETLDSRGSWGGGGGGGGGVGGWCERTSPNPLGYGITISRSSGQTQLPTRISETKQD